MKQDVWLFLQLISVSLRSQMQYRASFFMMTFSYAFSTFVGILGIWVLFDRFKLVDGWTFAEVSVIYGITHVGFGFAECFSRGLDKFDEMLITADFDRVLLRPIGTLFQVASSQTQLMRLGRLVQGLIVLIFGIHSLQISLFSFELLVIVMAIIGTCCLFYGLMILQATLAFWTTESLEVMNILSFGGVEACQYPITIYPKPFQLVFTYLIPLGLISYFPVATILGREQTSFVLLYPLGGILFLYLSARFWHYGVRRYTSAGN